MSELLCEELECDFGCLSLSVTPLEQCFEPVEEEAEINVNPNEKFGFQMRATIDNSSIATLGIRSKNTGVEMVQNQWLLDSNNRKTQPIFLSVGANSRMETFIFSLYECLNTDIISKVASTSSGVTPIPINISLPKGKLLYRSIEYKIDR